MIEIKVEDQFANIVIKDNLNVRIEAVKALYALVNGLAEVENMSTEDTLKGLAGATLELLPRLNETARTVINFPHPPRRRKEE